MNQPKITFIISKIPYALTATDVEAIKKMPSADRQQLMALLEAIKREENSAQPAATQATATSAAAAIPTDASTQSPASKSVDPDALMAQLAMQDKLHQPSGPTKESLYKWVAGITVSIIVLIFIS
jgi:hypothetical protein